MSWEEGLFVFFAAIAALSGIGIAITKNVIHAVLLLVVVILSLACLFVLLNAEFLAIVQVLIYAGGVVVLLAFGIMLTRRPSEGKLVTEHGRVVPGLLVVLALIFLLHRVIVTRSVEKISSSESENQVKDIGIGFMTEHLLAFELIAFLLLVVLVGAGLLARKSNES